MATSHRYLVVDYKTNRLGDPDRLMTAADYGRTQLVQAMLHSDYPLQALLYSVVLHRFLRWRQPGLRPGASFRRSALSVRAGDVRARIRRRSTVIPAGVFSWLPPSALVTELSDLLDRGRITEKRGA